MLVCDLLPPASSWATASCSPACRCARAPTWSARSVCCSPSPTSGKFLLKEPIIPAGADKIVFLLAPLISVVLALGAWAAIPIAPGWIVANINVGILYLFAVSSMGVYGIIMGGWASNSKYPFMGALRSAAQMISYEVSIGFVIVTVILLGGSMNLGCHRPKAGPVGSGTGIGRRLSPMAVIFFISSLAETNRPPFDLSEAESELVAGYQVEYQPRSSCCSF